jgi:hypothetical protein
MMWRKKKFIIGLLAAVLIICAGLGGVAFAQDNDEDSQTKTLIARVAEILSIDQQQLEDAVTQARTEMREEALDNYLQNLVDEGTITEDQAAEYKDWLDSRPDITEYNNQIKEWMESKPDIPAMPRTRVFGRLLQRGEMRLFDGLTLPSQ